MIPWGPIVSIAGHQTPLQLTDLPVAVLFILAMSSLGVYGIVLAGWSAQSPYSLLGALRSSAQMISYEVAMGLVVRAGLPVRRLAVDLADRRVADQRREFHFFGYIWHWPSWYAILLLPSFVIYLVTMVGETNRLPFDLPEGEGELVGGYHTEYSSLKFAMFYLAEYINMITVSALATTLFLGGWRAPWPLSVWSGANSGWWPVLWFLAKVLGFIFVFFWLRGSLPRIRYDQFMKLGWKVLIPSALVWTLIVATARVYRRQGGSPAVYVIGGGIIVVLLALCCGAGNRRPSAPSELAAEAADDRAAEADEAQRRRPRSRPRRWIYRITTASDVRAPASRCWPGVTGDDDEGGLRCLTSSTRSRASASPSGRCSSKVDTDAVPASRSCRPRRASTAGTSSTGSRTGWRSASAASCAPGPARPTRSTSRARTTPTEERFSPGERYGRVYQINYLRCIFCGLCIEACPTRALTMTNEYELADDSRESLICTKEQLVAPLLPGMEAPPHPMRLGDDEKDYYAARRDCCAANRATEADAVSRSIRAAGASDAAASAAETARALVAVLDPGDRRGRRPRSAWCWRARPCTARCCWPS